MSRPDRLRNFLADKVRQGTGVSRVRADTFGYLQRSFAGVQSEVDAAEARTCGQQAVIFSKTEQNGSVTMKRTGNGKDYAVEFVRTDLANVAEHTKPLLDEYINADGNGVTPAFKEYAMPLTGGLPKTEYLGGCPRV